jgi:prepilin peptidase CpaA
MALERVEMNFLEAPVTLAGGVCFTIALVLASVSDIRRRRIPNSLVIALALLGVGYRALVLTPQVGVPRALLSLFVGLGLWIPFYMLRMLGAGDVKLFAAASAWLTMPQVFGAAIVSALAGGVLSIIGLVLAHGIGLTTLRIAHGMQDPRVLATPLRVAPGRKTLPYGLAMAIGLAIVAWFPRWIHLN